MDIAALSMGISQMNVAQQASISVLKMAINTGEMQMEELLQMVQQNTKLMEQAVTPHLGQNVDICL